MSSRKLKVLRVSTTAYKEEDFFIMTDLSEEEISDTITPIVQAERDGLSEYDNETLHGVLTKRYPGRVIKIYEDFDKLEI